YGHDGPRHDWTSMNMNLQGYSGLMMVTGAENDPPTAISNSWNDYIGGLHPCFAILQAVDKSIPTPEGACLTFNHFECSASMIGPLLLSSAVNGAAPLRPGNRSAVCAPQGVYRCAGADEWCALSVATDEQWKALANAMGPWALDNRFGSVAGRMRYHDEIDQQIEAWTQHFPNTEIERRLKVAGIPAERVRRINDVIESPDSATVFAKMEEPRVGAMLTTRLPFSLASASLPPPRSAPGLGENSAEVLRGWLNLPDEAIVALTEQEALL